MNGVKYSEHLLIPHFNVVRCYVIDPMHCIFLGLAKQTIQTWKKKGVLDASHFILLQEKVDLNIPPSKIGCIPCKVESGFASFTADEWKNWILIYSVFALYKVLTMHIINVGVCYLRVVLSFASLLFLQLKLTNVIYY